MVRRRCVKMRKYGMTYGIENIKTKVGKDGSRISERIRGKREQEKEEINEGVGKEMRD